jgi:hypothetical protein
MLDATAAATSLRRGEFTATDLLEDCLAALARDNPALGAWTFIDAAGARAAALASDRRRATGAALGPLDGLPTGIKANVAVRGWPHTAGLRFRAAEFATADAFAVARLRAAGAVLVGATNMDEGALGAEGMNPWYGTTQNPHRAGHSSGGSSSGSAAAIAARHCTIALGSDTIGSVRIPAAFCGTAGAEADPRPRQHRWGGAGASALRPRRSDRAHRGGSRAGAHRHRGLRPGLQRVLPRGARAAARGWRRRDRRVCRRPERPRRVRRGRGRLQPWHRGVARPRRAARARGPAALGPGPRAPRDPRPVRVRDVARASQARHRAARRLLRQPPRLHPLRRQALGR